jgi:hypothetical protein
MTSTSHPLIHVQNKLNFKFKNNFKNIANNLSNTFTDYKRVTKYWNAAVNTPKRVEVSKKTAHSPSIIKRRRVATTKQDNTHSKRPRKENTETSSKDSECESTCG